MMNYILSTNGKIKKFSKSKKYKKSKTKRILLEFNSNFLGKYFKEISLDTYKQMEKVTQCSIKYKFTDGYLYDDEVEDNIIKKIKYKNISPEELLMILDEIYIAENIFNDAFWTFECYYCYFFDDFKITIFANNKKFVFKNILDVYKFFKFDRNVTKTKYSSNDIISVSKNRYKKYSSAKDFLKNNNKNKFTLTKLYSDIYVKINPKFYNIKSLYLKSKIYIKDIDETKCVFHEYDIIYNRDSKHNSDISALFERLIWNCIEKLQYDSYKVSHKISHVTPKKYFGSKIKFKKFINIFFKDKKEMI